MRIIGIPEEKKEGEKRVALVPPDLRYLTERYPDLRVRVENSSTRAYPDSDFDAIPGVEVVESVDDTPVIVAVKDLPAQRIRSNKVYALFSHTFKGQPASMEMLQALLDQDCTLVDYEMLVEDVDESAFDRGLQDALQKVPKTSDRDLESLLPRAAFQRRTVHFGRMAGIVGAFDTLWALGQRLEAQGIASPFGDLKRSDEYPEWAEGEKAIRRLGDTIRAEGVPEALRPLIIGVTGFSRNGNPGKTAAGAIEVLEALGAQPLNGPEDLHRLEPGDGRVVWRVEFDRDDTNNVPVFEKHLEQLTILVNCIRWMWWESRFVTRDFAKRKLGDGHSRPRVIGDVSCDGGGSVEFCVPTTFDNPTYVYEPGRDRTPGPDYWFDPENKDSLLGRDGPCRLGFEGDGPVVVAVDNLPTAFPRDASKEFSGYMMSDNDFPTEGNHLLPYQLTALAEDPAEQVAELDPATISRPLRRAVMVYRGKLTSDYEYLKTYLDERRKSQ